MRSLFKARTTSSFAFVLAASAALTLTACGSSSTSPTGGSSGGAGKVTAIKVAQYPIAGFAPTAIAQQKAFFAKEGLSYSPLTVSTPADVVPALVSGKIQFGFLNVGSLAAAMARHIPLKVLAPMYYENDDDGIFVKSSSSIKSLADLKGKTVGLVQLNNNVEAGVWSALEKAGVNPSDVKFTLIPQANILDALKSGKIDAAQIVEPGIAAGSSEIRSVLLNPLSASFGAHAVVAYTITTQTYASSHPAVVASFTKAINSAISTASTDPSAVRDAIASYTELTPAVLDKIALPNFGSDLKRSQADAQVAAMIKYKFLPAGTTITAAFAG